MKTRDAERSAAITESKEVSKKASKQKIKKSAGINNASSASSSTATMATIATSHVASKTTLGDVIGTDASIDGAASLSSTVAAYASSRPQPVIFYLMKIRIRSEKIKFS